MIFLQTFLQTLHFFSKCDQIRKKLRIGSHLLKQSLLDNFILCAVKLRTLIWYFSCRHTWTANRNWKIKLILTHFMSLVSFYTPWKHQKTRGFLMFSGRFSDVFREYSKRPMAWNGLYGLTNVNYWGSVSEFWKFIYSLI